MVILKCGARGSGEELFSWAVPQERKKHGVGSSSAKGEVPTGRGLLAGRSHLDTNLFPHVPGPC